MSCDYMKDFPEYARQRLVHECCLGKWIIAGASLALAALVLIAAFL
ncbi:hypothetical protein [Rhizobium brockwellii]